eukprot:CAMPEP_0206284508 /NCGR_PEP_ID=MMETSP0047_2-20121206/40810_1 /ASSEMBLY_ACC=CAM_ASM_000192 /TAXON_ID=195065 /ORGANISM="Chroomonas mesostigmatica_cf, Strain CCMP1168" /LENGTH=72 /DNA_ID=CAMNT_0053714963 /DNA_START=225 /DNA_END=440 /DNA_ORIENTATION=-
MPEKLTQRRADGVLVAKKPRQGLKAKLAERRQVDKLEAALNKDVPFLPKDITCGAGPMCLPADKALVRADAD